MSVRPRFMKRGMRVGLLCLASVLLSNAGARAQNVEEQKEVPPAPETTVAEDTSYLQSRDVFAGAFNGPKWGATLEWLYLTRTQANDRQLSVVRNTDTFVSNQRTLKDLQYDYQPGFRVQIDRLIYDSSTYLQLSYLGIPYWADTVAYITGGNQYVQSGIRTLGLTPTSPDFSNINGINQIVRTQSNFHDVEALIRTDLSSFPIVSVYGGMRYIHYLDRFSVTEYGNSAINFAGLGTVSVPSMGYLYQQGTNDIFGPEVGADVGKDFGDYLRGTITLKAGVMLNIGSVKNTVSVDPLFSGLNSTVRYSAGNDTKRAAGVFETAIKGTFKCSDYLKFHLGYRAIYLAGIAQGSEQTVPDLNSPFFQSGGQRTNFYGNVFIHGAFVALEGAWGGMRY